MPFKKGASSSSKDDGLEEVKSQVAALESQIQELSDSHEVLLADLGTHDQKLDEQLASCNEQVEEALTTASARQTDELLALRQERQNSERDVKDALVRLDSLTTDLASLREALTCGLDELGARQREAEARSEARSSGAAAGQLEQLEQQLLAKAEERCAALEARLAAKLEGQQAQAESALEQADARLTTRCELLQGGLDGLTREAAADKASFDSRQRETLAEVETKTSAQALRQHVKAELDESLGRLEALQRQQFEAIDRDLKANVAAMERAVQIVENVFTRSVVWQARGFKHRLRGLLRDDDQVIVSPGLFISSLPEIKLEIQLAARAGAGDASTLGPSLPLPSSCSIGVWAPAGLHAAFRLTVGEGRDTVSRRYEHDFEVQPGRLRDDAGRVLFVVQNFCRLNQVWIRSEDRIRVSFELLDFRSEPLSVLPALLPQARNVAALAAGGALPPPEDEAVAGEAAPAPAPPPPNAPATARSPAGGAPVELPAERPGTAPSPAAGAAAARAGGASPFSGCETPAAGREDAELRPALAFQDDDDELDVEALSPSTRPPPMDALQYCRGATSQEVVQERLQSELHAVKNRSVRRVEWRLEGCSRLLESRVGEAIDSPIFSAAGLERIQFHFYPRDTTASGTSSQPCGLFVSGPGKTSMKAMLWVGSFSRSLEHRFQKRGELGGRSRFCQLEKQVDCTDSVVLAMDIEEVESDMPDQSQMTLCLRDTRLPASVQGGVARPPATSSPLSGAKGLMRMKREDPSKTEEFVRCVSLPTLNARQLKLPLAMKSRPAP